jgi:hypothetical protein
VELSSPEQTDVILRQQGEQAEQRLIEENCVGDFDSGEVKAKENMVKCKEVSSAPHISYEEKGNVNSLCIPKSSTKTEIVRVKASKANCFASYVVMSNILNDSQRLLLLFDENSEMFHSKRLYEVLQISVPTKNSSNKLEHQCPKRSKRRYRHLQRHNPLYRNLRQNFRGGTYAKKNEGRKQTQGVPSNCYVL